MLRDRLLVLASVRCKMSDDNVNVAVQYIKNRLLEFSGRLVEVEWALKNDCCLVSVIPKAVVIKIFRLAGIYFLQ